MRVPAGLGTAGKRLWRSILDDLEPGWVLDARELALLARACSTADAIAELEAVVAREGVTTLGSRRQAIVHPAVGEARMQRLALARLLSSLELVDPAGALAAGSPAAARGAKAARARWSRENRRLGVA